MSRYCFIAARARAGALPDTRRKPVRYYQRQQRPAPALVAWQAAAQAAFTRHAHRYSTRRLWAELLAAAGRALVLLGHLARGLLPARRRLALDRAGKSWLLPLVGARSQLLR